MRSRWEGLDRRGDSLIVGICWHPEISLGRKGAGEELEVAGFWDGAGAKGLEMRGCPLSIEQDEVAGLKVMDEADEGDF